MQAPEMRHAIATLGNRLSPEVLSEVIAILDDEQRKLAALHSPIARDLPYGSHERQVLDIYAPVESAHAVRPVVVFVHGGGFLKGDKGSAQRWYNANVGMMAASNGLLGVVINYRLAPENTWPSGGEDVGLAVDWLAANIANYGGDPENLFLIGTSAGAVHCATYLKLTGGKATVKGAVLLSGLYGFTPLDERDTLYYGAHGDYPARWPKDAVIETRLPLMLACAEFDPPRFQAEFLGLMQSRLEQHGTMTRAVVLSGHNHFSMASHLGCSDTRLSDEILGFITEFSGA